MQPLITAQVVHQLANAAWIRAVDFDLCGGPDLRGDRCAFDGGEPSTVPKQHPNPDPRRDTGRGAPQDAAAPAVILVEVDIERRTRLLRQVRSTARRKVTDDMLREVAAIYRSSVDINPTQQIADHFGKDPRTARLYVHWARRKGFLGAALTGKAGER